MKDVKYKFWDKFNEEWLDSALIAITGLGEIYSTVDNDYLSNSEIIPLQYTGLKDKNGVDIYEGDIVKPQMSGAKPFEVKYKTESVGVNGGHGESYSDLFSGFKITGYYGSPRKCVVIGNVYENPELLELK